MTNGLSGSDATSISSGSPVQSGRRRSAEARCFPRRMQMTQRMHWRSFENSLKTEARFFSRTAANHLTSVFDGIGELRTRDGRPLVVDAGPRTDFHTVYRARVFQSDDKLEAALCRPDIHLGSPPALSASA